MTTLLKLFSASALAITLSGCFVSNTVGAGLRAVGGATTAIPVVGDAIDSALEATANVVEIVPL